MLNLSFIFISSPSFNLNHHKYLFLSNNIQTITQICQRLKTLILLRIKLEKNIQIVCHTWIKKRIILLIQLNNNKKIKEMKVFQLNLIKDK